MTFATDNWKADDVTRSLPHAVGPEKSVLSTLLQDPQEYIPLAIEEGLTADHFYLPAHSTLFGFLLELFGKGIEIELVSLVQKLLDRGLLDRVGGPAALTDLYTYAATSGHFRAHLGELKLKFIGRRIIQISNEHIAAVYDAPEEVPDTLDSLERSVLQIREESESAEPEQSLKSAVEHFIDALGAACNGKQPLPGLTTGFEELDRMTNGGMKPGDMFVVAARPSMGKTSFMMNVVEHVAIDLQKPSLVFSVEMSLDQLVARLVASRAKFDMSQLSRGYTPNKGDLQRIQRVASEVANAKKLLHVDQRGNITIEQLRAKARRKKRDEDIEFIAIDYMQLLRSSSKQAKDNREREISEISAGIKSLAKELQIPIMILAQLNRGPESRNGKQKGVPRMSDLRESGSIEQDADMVGLLYRSAYYADNDQERNDQAGIASLTLAKNRNGETGDIPLTFIAELMRFETGKPYLDPPPQSHREPFE